MENSLSVIIYYYQHIHPDEVFLDRISEKMHNPNKTLDDGRRPLATPKNWPLLFLVCERETAEHSSL